MLVPQVAVDFHRQGSAVFVAQPAADRRDVDAGFDATGGEEVAKVMVGDATDADGAASSG